MGISRGVLWTWRSLQVGIFCQLGHFAQMSAKSKSISPVEYFAGRNIPTANFYNTTYETIPFLISTPVTLSSSLANMLLIVHFIDTLEAWALLHRFIYLVFSLY